MSKQPRVDKAMRMAQYGNYYLSQLLQAEQRGIIDKGNVEHDAPQILTWIYKLLRGDEIRAWQTDTEGVIRKMQSSTRSLYDKIEQFDKEKKGEESTSE